MPNLAVNLLLDEVVLEHLFVVLHTVLHLPLAF